MKKAGVPVNRRGNPDGLWVVLNAGLRGGVAPMRRFRNVKISGETDIAPCPTLSIVASVTQ